MYPACLMETLLSLTRRLPSKLSARILATPGLHHTGVHRWTPFSVEIGSGIPWVNRTMQHSWISARVFHLTQRPPGSDRCWHSRHPLQNLSTTWFHLLRVCRSLVVAGSFGRSVSVLFFNLFSKSSPHQCVKVPFAPPPMIVTYFNLYVCKYAVSVDVISEARRRQRISWL